MAELTKRQKKELYSKKLIELVTSYNKILLVQVDNVGAFSIQKMRQAMRGKSVVLFGKNTLIRKTIRDYVEKCQEAKNDEGARIENLLPFIKGNVGLIFTNDDLVATKDLIESFKQKAPAKAGTIAPEDVFVDPGPTGMEPTQTQFLQALNISSKIVKGQVEITNRVHLVKAGEKIGNSEATLLDKLNIMPFSYRAAVKTIFDSGFCYSATLLGLGVRDVMETLSKGVQRIASISLEIGFPCLASVPHLVAKAYRNMISISIETNYDFEGSKEVKEFLKDPSAFLKAAPVTTAPTQGKTEEKKEEAPPPKVEEKEEESVGDLFGSDD